MRILPPVIQVLALAFALGPLASGPARAERQPKASPIAGALAPGIRGVLALEPGRIRAGEVATLEIVVTTPPGYRLRPVVPPAELPGFWILDAEALPVEEEDGRWIHRTRLRLRARELGQYAWPAQPVEIEAPDGSLQELVLEGRPLEVVSVQPEFPGRSVPFGLREPDGEAPGPTGPAWGAAAGGALAGAAAVALAGVVRRRRRARHAAVSDGTGAPPAPGLAPWDAARDAVEEATARIAADPDGAGDALARALRSYASWRWRRDFQASTTPELAALPPPPESSDHWPELVALLAILDEARFLPPPETDRRERVHRAASRARAFLAATTPPGARP